MGAKKIELCVAKSQGFGPSCFASGCHAWLTKLLGCLQEDGVDDFQRRNHYKNSGLVCQGGHTHLNFQQPLKEVVVPLGRKVEGSQLLDAGSAEWYSWRWGLPAVQPVQVATADVRAVGFQSYPGLV
jgi:hypothetical protein